MTIVKTDQCKNQGAHHWVIDTASGPISKGRCKKCKVTREFFNSIFTNNQHITLAKEVPDAERDQDETHP